jgi:hypothetical protein
LAYCVPSTLLALADEVIDKVSGLPLVAQSRHWFCSERLCVVA